jgi:2-dehydropantoate 2-reductase
MKIIIFGAGAIGSYFGASLILSGNEVVFLERESTADSLLKTGISLYRKEIVQKVSGLRVCTSISSALREGPFDFGILAVKSYDTQTFLHSIQSEAAALPPIVCLQNGVENEGLLAQVFSQEKVIAGSVTTAIGRETPGIITVEKLRGVGVAGNSPLVGQVVDAFTRAGLKAKRFKSIANMKWSKMLTNLPANASAAILNMTPAEIFKDKRLFGLEMEQLRETRVVMRAMGIKVENLPGTPVKLLALGSRISGPLGQELFGGILAGGRGNKKPSFLIEIQSGSKNSEVDYLNGVVARKGKENGIPTPVNTTLTRTLKEIINGERKWKDFDHQPESLIALVEKERERE